MKRASAVLLLLLLPAAAQAFARGADCGGSETCGLVIRGEVAGLEVEKADDHVNFHVRLNVEFRNEGTEPIILFAPEFKDYSGERRSGYWLGGWLLYKTEAEAAGGRPIFSDGYWQSVSGSEDYRGLAEALDVKSPPGEHTIILRPGESWKSPDTFRIYFTTGEHVSYRLKWEEMQAFPPRLWLVVEYELSPWNVEHFKPGLIRKLKRRWAAYGNVLVTKKKEDGFNLFRTESQPMLIDFSRAKETGGEVRTGMR